MGLSDEIVVSNDVLCQLSIECPKCHKTLDDKYQTKSLECVMETYYMRHSLNEDSIKLYKLDPPDKKFWVAYTKEEIEEWNNGLDTGNRLLEFLRRRDGDGYYKEEAFLPLNRRQRDMGELPHMWLEMYTQCKECKIYADVHVKFTDGCVEDIRITYDEH